MADRKISDLTALTTPAAGDYLPIVDVSEASAANKNKRITIEELLRGAPDGTAGAPSIAFESDPNTGIYSPGADQVAISTGGSGRLFVDASGNVGVGVTPSELLHVNGNAIVKDRLLLQRLQSSDNLSVLTFADTLTGSKGNNLSIGNPGGFDVLFHTGGVEKARIDSSGRLLVGTSTAETATIGGLLQVQGTGSSAAGMIKRNSANASGPYIYLAKSRGATVGSTTIVQSGDSLGEVRFAGADGSTEVGALGALIKAEVDGTPGANDMPGRLVFSVTADGASSPTERMRIQSTGKTVIFAASGQNVLGVHTASAAGTTDYAFYVGSSATSTTAFSATNLGIFTNGNVVNTNTSYGGISDIKLKENIVDATSQWDDIKALQVRKYNFKEGQTHTQIGVIAQEVELVSPGLVNETPDRDEDGNDLGTTTKSVAYSVLYMKAVKALQEAMERIEVLEQRLNDAGIN